MKRIEKILLPTDFSDTADDAFVYALLLAEKLGAEIHLLNCIYLGIATAELPAYTGDLLNKMQDQGKKNMQKFVERGITKVVQQLRSLPAVTSQVEVGSAVILTKQFAEENNFDLIIMGTNGAHDNWSRLFGTNASGVLVDAPCPVLVLPENARFRHFQKLCFATDLEDVNVLLGRQLIARFHPMVPDLHFLHVSRREAEEHSLDFELISTLYARQDVNFKVDISELSSKDIPKAIIKEAEQLEADLVVMYRPHHGVFDQLFHKSVTREVALTTSVPLLVLSDGPETKAGFN